MAIFGQKTTNKHLVFLILCVQAIHVKMYS